MAATAPGNAAPAANKPVAAHPTTPAALPVLPPLPEPATNNMRTLHAMPVLRSVALAGGRNLNHSRPSNMESWMAQHVGTVSTEACKRCKARHGPYSSIGGPCVLVPGLFNGACAGCQWSSEADVIDSKADSITISDGGDAPSTTATPSRHYSRAVRRPAEDSPDAPPARRIRTSATAPPAAARLPPTVSSAADRRAGLRYFRNASPASRVRFRAALSTVEVDEVNAAEEEE